ncbi:MAG TPA: cycloisomerase [Hyphomicrobiales bacterium]|nr:cycloisomerase [Hyphomicrobiales bacterium]
MLHLFSRRKMLLGLAGAAGAAATAWAAESVDSDALRAAYRSWLESLPAAPPPELTKHGLVATELKRWHVLEANQGVAVDAGHFYGIGNHALVKHRKDNGERVAQWFGPRGGAIIHLNSGWVDENRLVLSHSSFPQLPMASSLETYDTRTLQPLESYSFGIRLGSLTWAVRHQGYWWACFANYNDSGTTPGFDQRWTYVARFDDNWQQLQSWLFPPQVIATWGDSACSGGDFGEDGLLYVTGHDEPQLHVLRLPKQGVTLEYVTTIDVPFEGQSWAWDRSARGERVIYGISRARQEVIVARIPEVPAGL